MNALSLGPALLPMQHLTHMCQLKVSQGAVCLCCAVLSFEDAVRGAKVPDGGMCSLTFELDDGGSTTVRGTGR